MNIYLFFLFFIVFYSFIGYNPTKPINKNVYWFIAIMLILFAALRGNGYDWDSYYEIYRGVHTGNKREGAEFVEYGFQLLCYVCPYYRILIATVAILSVSLALSAIYNLSSYSRLPLLGLVIFYTTYLFGGHMGQIRQALAGGFVLWAIVNSLNQQKNTSNCTNHYSCVFSCFCLVGIGCSILAAKKVSARFIHSHRRNSFCDKQSIRIAVYGKLYYGWFFRRNRQINGLCSIGKRVWLYFNNFDTCYHIVACPII